MQLIFETEPMADIRNMSSLEEPLQDTLLTNGVIEELNRNSTNGNKENIIREDNIICSVEEKSKIDDQKAVNVKISDSQETHIIQNKNVNEVTSSMDSAELICSDDKITIENEDQTIVDNILPNSLDHTKSSVEIQENGITMNEVSSELPGTDESHTSNNTLPVKTSNCDLDVIDFENDTIDELTQIKENIANFLLEKSTSPNDMISQQTEKTISTLDSKNENAVDTFAAPVVDNVEKDISTQELEKHSQNLISTQEKEQHSKANEENLSIDNIFKEQEIIKGDEVLVNDNMIPDMNNVTPTEKCTDLNIGEPIAVDIIKENNINFETKVADSMDEINKLDDEVITNDEIISCQNSAMEIDVEKGNNMPVVEKNNSAQQLNTSDITMVNEQVITNIENNEEKPELKSITGDTKILVNNEENAEDNTISENIMDCDEINEDVTKDTTDAISNDEVMVVEDSQDDPDTTLINKNEKIIQPQIEKETEKLVEKTAIRCRLSNTLNILSDDEDEPPVTKESPKKATPDKQCINIEDDDDIMLIEDTSGNDSKSANELNKTEQIKDAEVIVQRKEDETDLETGEKKSSFMESIELSSNKNEKEPTSNNDESPVQTEEEHKTLEESKQKGITDKTLLSDYFLKSSKKKISDMTRDDLEEFCVLKIVESIVDRSNLSEIKTKLKSLAQSIDEYRKKTMMLTKQNRDLQVVLKSVQEEQKKASDIAITPLKITRSVGMQVLMTEKSARKKANAPAPPPAANNARQTRNQANQNQRLQKPAANQVIPVPRLVPANNAAKSPAPQNVTPAKPATPLPNGVRNSPPAQKQVEKRPRKQSVTVDLTDDEPPSKISSRNPVPPVRLVSPQNLLAAQRPQLGQAVNNSPRKVYIPIGTPQTQPIRPSQTIILKSPQTGRPRGASANVTRMPQNNIRVRGLASVHRHPAPLPDALKQYQPPNWKALPPAPDLKLSKVENGIVISWKIEGYQEDSYEEIASYQLYAYQETTSPPSTSLWKKIGDVKALPLPMACTLTQFMAGFKYYFAVRAVDVKSRLGSFSLPGSILLLNKI